jgi:hypothetical protein
MVAQTKMNKPTEVSMPAPVADTFPNNLHSKKTETQQ